MAMLLRASQLRIMTFQKIKSYLNDPIITEFNYQGKEIAMMLRASQLAHNDIPKDKNQPQWSNNNNPK